MRTVSALACAALVAAVSSPSQSIDLPTSKQIVRPVPGAPKRLNNLPMSIAVSPDKRWVVTVNAGYGSYESGYAQSLAVTEVATGKVTDFPDARMVLGNRHSLYSGLAFSPDGKHVYATVGSTSDPDGKRLGDLGNGIVVYSFADGAIKPQRVISIPVQQLGAGRETRLLTGAPGTKAVPFPAALAVVPGSSEKLLVADNLSDDALLVDVTSGKVEKRFDLSENDAVPSVYPVGAAVTADGSRGFVTLWNGSEVVEIDLQRGAVSRKLALLKPLLATAAGTHPSDVKISPDGNTLYVALTNRDAVTAIDIAANHFEIKGYYDTRLPGQTYFGAEPESIALSDDGSRMYVANAMSDAVSIYDTHKLTAKAVKDGFVEPIGFFPTEWMPMSLAQVRGRLFIATAKGKGPGPNNFAQKPSPFPKGMTLGKRPMTYILSLMNGSMAVVDAAKMEHDLKAYTSEVLEANRMKSAQAVLPFAEGKNPIKHAIYIIKENRTYDQVMGDLQKDGKPVGNGDPSLAMYGSEVTPNQHLLALQFGVLDNFYDSGEVSGQGHTWSTTAMGSDYLDKTIQSNYGRGQRTYDYEGVVADGFPILQKIPDVNEPAGGYIWANLASHGKSLYHFAEFIASTFCSANKRAVLDQSDSQAGPMLRDAKVCDTPTILPGKQIPAFWGGGTNAYQWPIPVLAKNTPTKPELVGHFAPEYPDFNLLIPDQIRFEVFKRHFEDWVKERATGKDTMPDFLMVRMGNNHTRGTAPGGPMPKASVADNDLAVGRLVDLVSHSAYWADTAIFILEDDAQNGADHVDAHRSPALVVSKYAPHGKEGRPFVDSTFYSTVSMIRTMELVLGLPPMNNNDAFASAIMSEFTGPGDQPAFNATYVNRDNKLIYTAAQPNAVGAADSLKMDFVHADRADTYKLNIILWKDAMGSNKPVPPQLLVKPKKSKKHDDDDD